jgi:hypothetical protein
MAESVALSSFVLFLDACSEQQAGSIRSVPVDASDQACRFTHHLVPSSLLKAAQQIYGQAPPAVSMTLAGESFALGDGLSSGVCNRLPEFVRKAKETVATRLVPPR